VEKPFWGFFVFQTNRDPRLTVVSGASRCDGHRKFSALLNYRNENARAQNNVLSSLRHEVL
jgi:hypothetical protein